MSFWSNLIYITMGVKFLKYFTECMEQNKADGKPVTPLGILGCVSDAADQVFQETEPPVQKLPM